MGQKPPWCAERGEEMRARSIISLTADAPLLGPSITRARR